MNFRLFRSRPTPPWLSPLAALLLLNGMLSFSTWWPTPGIVPDHRLAPEFLWSWLILLGLVRWRGGVSPRLIAVLAVGYLTLVLGRYIDVTAPALFGREINLFWDAPQIPRFLWVTAGKLPFWVTPMALTLLALFFWTLHRVLRWAIGQAADSAAPHVLRSRTLLGLTAAATLLVVLNHAGVRATWPFVSKPVLPTYLRQAEIILTANSPERLARLLPPSTALDTALAAPPGTALGGLDGRDLYLIVLESYGAITYDASPARAAFKVMRERLAARIAAGGQGVVSAFLRAPTFGGASDLSHLSLLSGIDISDPLRHDVLLTTRRPTLIGLFRDNGYRTYGMYTALSWEWPERAYYGYDVFVDGPGLGYPGPSLGYWHVPDQYAVARFEQMHPRTPGEPPRFVFLPTITCHFPFSPVPPYQPDPATLLGPEPYAGTDLARALAERTRWRDMFPDYARMVDYTLRWLGDYLERLPPRETVYVLVGDHQPPANVTGEGVSWDVPVYIVSRDAALLRRFERHGFRPGLEPPRAALGGLHDFTAILLDAFATPMAAVGR